MKAKRITILLFTIITISQLQAQYIPFPEALKLNRRPPYLNPSVNDPLFYSKHLIFCGLKNLCNKIEYAKACTVLGTNLYYHVIRKIYINIVTGDYYDPSTGLIYRKAAVVDKQPIDGRVGPNPPSSSNPPIEPSDKIYLPKDLRKFVKPYYDGDECPGCKIVRHDTCDPCWVGEYHNGCNVCYKQKYHHYPYKAMGSLIIDLLNKYRVECGLTKVGSSKKLYYIALAQSLYMAHRGYLNNDNFLAHISTYDAGNLTTGYINATSLSNKEGALKFLRMWRQSPEHNDNLLSADINRCGAAIYFDAHENKFYATLICVK